MRSIGSLLIACALLTGTCIARRGALTAGDSGSSNPQENPFSGRADAIMAGRKLFLRNCSHCHGPDGLGRNKAANLRSAIIRSAPPGTLFHRVRNGNLRAGMPSWAHLPDQQIWQLVTYIQSMQDGPEDGPESSRVQR